MKQITNKEYEEFLKYKEDKLYGRLLTSDGLRLICAAENYDLGVESLWSKKVRN